MEGETPSFPGNPLFLYVIPEGDGLCGQKIWERGCPALGAHARGGNDWFCQFPTQGTRRGDALLNRTRQPFGHPTTRVDCDFSRLLRRGPPIRMAILAILFIHCSTAFGQTPTDGIQGVQPAGFRLGQPVLYGILQQLPSPPLNAAVPEGWRNGVLLRVMITAEPAAQWRTGGAACRQFTAQHFFLFPSESRHRGAAEAASAAPPPGSGHLPGREGQGVCLVPRAGCPDGRGLSPHGGHADARRLRASDTEKAAAIAFRGPTPRRRAQGRYHRCGSRRDRGIHAGCALKKAWTDAGPFRATNALHQRMKVRQG